MDGEPEAYRDETLRSISISPKERLQRIEEMLVKIDEKMDSKFDVLELRIRTLEINVAPVAEEAKKEIERLNTVVQGIHNKILWASGAIAALVMIAQIVANVWH